MGRGLQTGAGNGARTRDLPLEYAEKFAKLIPGATLEVIPACGHMVPMETQTEWIAAPRRFPG